MKLLKVLSIGILVTFFIAGAAFAGKKSVPQFFEGTVRVSAEEVIDLVEQYDEAVLIDARKKIDVTKGFIEGSVNLPNSETNEASLVKYIASKSTPVIFYCNGVKCGRSLVSAKIAIAAGYNNIYWFRGGMQEWEAKGFPVVRP